MDVIKFNIEDMKNNNDGFSYYILGRSYDLEENGVCQDYDKAFVYYLKGHNLGYPLCTYSLGISYILGLGDVLEIDEEKGNQLLVDAYDKILQLINSDNTDEIEKVMAKFVIGAYYYFGLGNINKDYKKAFMIIRECALKGHIAAIYDLGANFYYFGNGVEKNSELSKFYLEIAKKEKLKRAIDKYKEYGYGEDTKCLK